MPAKPMHRVVLLSRHATPESSGFLYEAFKSMRSVQPESAFRALGSRGAARGIAAAEASGAAPKVGAAQIPMRVIDSIHEDKAKLVEIDDEGLELLRRSQPGLKVVPEVFYTTARFMPEISSPSITRRTARAASRTPRAKASLTVTVVCRTDGKPVADATVYAFTDVLNLIGEKARTKAGGKAKLALKSGTTAKLLLVYCDHTYWGLYQIDTKLSDGDRIAVEPIDFSAPDAVRHFYPASNRAPGRGVKVGIVDTGIAMGRADLPVAGGECTVVDEDPADFGDFGGRHGTHCAGIVGARASAPNGFPGVAPGVELFSYRVFPKMPAKQEASNFSIAKAIDRAVIAGCDIINLSLGGGPSDDATRGAIDDAREAGVLCVCAAGNKGRAPVSFPASYGYSIAVSAIGRKGAFPNDSCETFDVASPFGTDRKDFVARFSNIGPEIKLAGPGVGVVSTVPEGWGVMSGTSMACPAVAGAAAALLAANPGIMQLGRNAQRRDAIAGLLLQSARSLGLGLTFEGSGIPVVP
ncbi:MAG: S8 family serine peptidase [Phycisphaerales bacterium]